jgi:hypothetical protein
MTASFIELNPPDVQGKVYRICNAIALFASLFPASAEVGDDALLFGNMPQGLLQHSSATMEARPHGSDWATHYFRDLLIRNTADRIQAAVSVMVPSLQSSS